LTGDSLGQLGALGALVLLFFVFLLMYQALVEEESNLGTTVEEGPGQAAESGE